MIYSSLVTDFHIKSSCY